MSELPKHDDRPNVRASVKERVEMVLSVVAMAGVAGSIVTDGWAHRVCMNVALVAAGLMVGMWQRQKERGR